jgi:hypothetical protein
MGWDNFIPSHPMGQFVNPIGWDQSASPVGRVFRPIPTVRSPVILFSDFSV